MLKRVILYARVSTRHQRKNFSIPSQFEQMRQYALNQGMEVVAELQDVSTGTNTQRSGLNQALAMLTQGQANVLIVYRLDRLTRDPLDRALLRRQLEQLGVELHYALSGRRVGASVEDDLADEQEARAAQIERHNLAERMTRGRQAKIRSGQWLGHGNVPYGYRVEGHGAGKRLVVQDEHAQIVRQIFQWYVNGAEDGTPLSSMAIARKLTALRIPTPHDIRGWAHKKRAYAEWTAHSLYPILRQKAYVGKLVYNRVRTLPDGRKQRTEPDKWVEVDAPAIFEDTQLWEAAQAKLDRNGARAAKRIGNEYLLAQRFTCVCGYHLIGSPSYRERSHIYLYYHCAGRIGTNARSCDMPYLRTDRVDAAVWRWIETMLLKLETLEAQMLYQEGVRAEIEQSWQTQVRVIEAEQMERESQIRRLLQLYARDVIPLAQLEAEVVDCRASLDRGNEQLALLRQKTPLHIYEERIALLRGAIAGLRGEQPAQEWNFAAKRALVELIDLRVTLVRKDNELWLHITTTVCEDETVYQP